jgi:hypothetical protein
MTVRITIYGWVLAPDHPVYGKGSGSLVDLVYFVSDDVTVRDVLNVINYAGYKMIPKRIGNKRDSPVEQDKVTIDNWDDHIKVGVEQVPTPSFNNQPAPQEGIYSRYNPPSEMI